MRQIIYITITSPINIINIKNIFSKTIHRDGRFVYKSMITR